MEFVGIEFGEESGGGVAIVHEKWMTPRKREVYWPPYKQNQKYMKALRSGEAPGTTWSICQVKRTFFHCDTYETANKKIKLCENRSDVGTDLEIIEDVISSKRIRKPTRRISFDDDSSDDQNAKKQNQLVRPPRLPIDERRADTEPTSQQPSTSSSKPNAGKYSSAGTSSSSTPKSSVSSQHRQHPPERPEQDIIVEDNWNNVESTPQSVKISEGGGAAYHTKVLQGLSYIKQQNDQILKLLEDGPPNKATSATFELPDNIPANFPLSNEDDLKSVEHYLSKNKNLSRVAAHFSTLGGRDITNKTNVILKKIITSSFATEFSFLGTRNNKKAFSSLRLETVVLRAVQTTSPNTTEKEIADIIKNWLKHAPERVAKERRRHSDMQCEMAGNDGTTQTELWSSVVHQPSEEPEESELPSTVDMAAFSSGLNVDGAGTSQNNENSDSTDSEVDSSNSGSEASQSGSQSDSSDSDSSTSSLESSSRSPSPEFSVKQSSQTNGLRLTIATVRKSSGSPVSEKMTTTKSSSETKVKDAVACSSSSSPCSSASESESEEEEPSKSVTRSANKAKRSTPVKRTSSRTVEKKDDKKSSKKDTPAKSTTRHKAKPKKSKRVSVPLSRGSYSSSDSEDSDADRVILASCSLQEIRQEDLAAILPDQQECDAFGEFDNRDKSSPQTGDMSGSDMELPQQAVNALIQRTTESSSESESHAPPNPSSLMANSLLQQFVAQTQMLNAPCPAIPQNSKPITDKHSEVQTSNNNNTETNVVKRKRGRPRKGETRKKQVAPASSKPEKLEYCGDPNVSPDSGIQNSPDHVSSPEPSRALTPHSKVKKEVKKLSTKEAKPKVITATTTITKPNLPLSTSKELAKISVTSNRFDRLMYGNTDRVLYPPRRKVGRPPIVKKGPGRPPKHKPSENLDNNKNMKAKQESRPVLVAKNKLDNTKIKYTTLKNLKVMHSKHNKKHKKCKFRILKPLSVVNDPKMLIEIDALVVDFAKQCVIGTTKPPKENVPEIKTVKKVVKKRKTTENVERKKKKISVNADNKVTNLNEQRLPLKKRHYLFSDGKSNFKQVKVEESPVKEENVTVPVITATTPKKRHRLEAISSPPDPIPDNAKPKPKLSLENLITELKMKRTLPKPAEEPKPVDPIVETKEIIKTVENVRKRKIRKRRAINRTGFPTVKKKKKKNPIVSEVKEDEKLCDRVPKEGEEYSIFIQRTEEVIPQTRVIDDSKWDTMSECDSLPQDERIENEKDGDDLSLNEISLEASIERLKSRLDKKRKRSSDKGDNLNGYPKRRLRDVSPASSIEPCIDRRLREERASASGDDVKKGKKAPRGRKRYLVAGLFSDYYKEDDETARIKRAENVSLSKSRLVYNPAEHPYGLFPPPYHCGKYLRCRKLSFQLPHDIWWQHTHSQLPGRDMVPSWNYRKIRTNVYNLKIDVKTGACEPQSCNCTSSSNCGDDCINRLVLAECPASHRCHNQKIQRHEWAPGIEKFMTELKGWGVRTKLPIKCGEFILEYVGEVVSDQEFKERMATIYVNDTHHYCLHLDGGLVIDGHRMGGDGRFVNHSCQPNCEMQKWSVNGQFRMALFALRDIDSSEELTYDYNFSLFNPAEGQECKCGSKMCRGVIGGKSQRVRQLPPAEQPIKSSSSGRVGRPRKNQAKKTTTNRTKDVSPPQPALAVAPTPPVKPMSHQQKCFILEHHCFLLRNLSKVKKKVRDRSNSAIVVARPQVVPVVNHAANFINHLNALEKPRNIKTRRFAQAEDNPVLNKTVKLASVLKEIWNTVSKAKDEKNESLATLFMTMPTKRKSPEFYQRITNPIDLSTIEQNIATGIYLTAESFNADMNRLFTNYIRFYGRTSVEGVAALRLKKIYTQAKERSLSKFENVLGTKPPANFISSKNKDEEEDIIRCICGMPRDEGLMIQCEKCLVWQHSECVKADVSADSYHCERCVHRDVDYEIALDEYTEHGHRYYMTLLRGDLQLRQGDTVYVLRDIPIPGTERKHTYDTISKVEYADLDIFRIERLWKDSETGQRFAYGHHYLRPHETYHEPTRKFFSNEVMRVPLYEAVPVELIISNCWVMDVNTFCKGRPIGAPEEHIYICEYRVDKSARLFSKVSKSKFPICTKSFVFERFETRLKISRTYTPHDLDPTVVRPRGRKPQENEDSSKEANAALPIYHVPVIRTPAEQKARLNSILLNLLGKLPVKQVLDISYLLEGGRRRKKHAENGKN